MTFQLDFELFEPDISFLWFPTALRIVLDVSCTPWVQGHVLFCFVLVPTSNTVKDTAHIYLLLLKARFQLELNTLIGTNPISPAGEGSH